MNLADSTQLGLSVVGPQGGAAKRLPDIQNSLWGNERRRSGQIVGNPSLIDKVRFARHSGATHKRDRHFQRPRLISQQGKSASN